MSAHCSMLQSALSAAQQYDSACFLYGTLMGRNQEKLAALRHAAACFKPLVGVNPIFQKLQKWQTPEPNTKECMS